MPRRILVVDDQESIQYFLRKTLESEGYEVDGVGDLAAARVALQKTLPDAIVGLDLDCGVFADGFESGDTSAWS